MKKTILLFGLTALCSFSSAQTSGLRRVKIRYDLKSFTSVVSLQNLFWVLSQDKHIHGREGKHCNVTLNILTAYPVEGVFEEVQNTVAVSAQAEGTMKGCMDELLLQTINDFENMEGVQIIEHTEVDKKIARE